MAQDTTTLFTRVGGTPAVAAVIDEFYLRLLADPVTAPLLGSADLASHKLTWADLLADALGGSEEGSTGPDLRAAHAGFGVTGDIYARVCLHLLTVMHDSQWPIDALVLANQSLQSVQDQVVSR